MDSQPAPLSRVIYGLAALLVVVELVPNLFGEYGTFIDEFYYVACSERLAFGYVDHPPLSVWLLHASRALFGDSQLALRVVPALAGAVTVVVTGVMAQRLGAGLWGQRLAGLAILAAPIPMLFFGFYSMNALEIAIWATAALVLIERARTQDGRWWLVFGAVAGIGLLNKHTFVLFGAGLALGVVLTPARRELASRWLWGGVVVALLVFSPNLIWQIANDWPSLEFYAAADENKSLATPALEVLAQQILFLNPISALVWGAGVAFFLFARDGRPWRHLGWIFLALLVLIVASQRSRPDRIVGVYPVVLAAGTVAWERLCARRALGWARWALPSLMVLAAAAFAPIALPILPPATLASYSAALGIVPQIEAGAPSALPQWMADRFGWQELVDQFEDIVATELSEEERERAVILVPGYGYAGALELLGRGRGLPPIACPHNSYHSWPPLDSPAEVVISLGYGPRSLGDLYGWVEQVATTSTTYGMPYRNGQPIFLSREPVRSLWEVWERFRGYG